MTRSPIDFSEFLVRVENDRELMRDLLEIFKEEFPRHCEALRQAVELRNATSIASEAHFLKGMLSNVAAHEAAELAAVLERAGRNGNTAECREVFTKFAVLAKAILQQVDDGMAEVPR
jgi:HPt (histidine-containing phosphotransfer) domain-containing protein